MEKLSAKTTRMMGEAVTRGVLEKSGYELEEKDGYLLASKEGEKDLLVYCTGRALSRNESTPIRVLGDAVNKLAKRAEELAGAYVPCIAYFIAKYNVTDFELCVVPVQTIRELGERGGHYSCSGGNFHYNYAKVADDLPEGAIVRATWRGNLYTSND